MCTPEEKKKKYQPQEKWQKKNGYTTKTYRLSEDTINALEEASKKYNMPQAQIFRESLEYYKKQKDKKSFYKKYNETISTKRMDIKKGFKAKDKTGKEIDKICIKNNFTRGAFMTTAIDDFLKYLETLWWRPFILIMMKIINMKGRFYEQSST